MVSSNRLFCWLSTFFNPIQSKKPTFFLLQINQVIKGMTETISSSTIPLISLDINRVMSLSSSSSQKTVFIFWKRIPLHFHYTTFRGSESSFSPILPGFYGTNHTVLLIVNMVNTPATNPIVSHQSNRQPAGTQHFLEGRHPCPRASPLFLSSCPQADTDGENSKWVCVAWELVFGPIFQA